MTNREWLLAAMNQGGLISAFDSGLGPGDLENTDDVFYHVVNNAYEAWLDLLPDLDYIENMMKDCVME